LKTDDALRYLAKGCVDVVTSEALRAKLSRGTSLTVKVGFDPTAPDIHLGHTVLMRKMRQFQELGHRVVFVIGDFTGMIGDPTGRSKTRPPLTRDEIERNAETYKVQAFKILDPRKTETRFNSEWLSGLGSEGFVRLAATYNVARMLERREFRQRYDAGQPISIHEFLYPLAQAYDSVALEVDVELGGTDQLFNLNVGRDIMPSYGLEPQVVMTTPLLEGLDGVEKMSKSLGNYVGVTDSPETMYSKLLSISDELMWRYFLLLTDLEPRAIEEERAKAAPMASKMSLARRLVTDFHGAEAAAYAEAEWRRVHQDRQAPSEMPVKRIAAGRYKPHELLALHGLAKSRSEGARLVKQRAVKRDGIVVDGGEEIRAEAGGSFVVSVGPKVFVRFEVDRERESK
jgi:tyrosyl-tRNA synthetase